MKSKTIAIIKKLLNEDKLTYENMIELRMDERKGVQTLVESYNRRQAKEEAIRKRFNNMWTYENLLFEGGNDLVAGVDEAGRGPLAGPVVAAAVILPKSFNVIGITDSKQLSAKDRDYYYDKIKETAISYSVSVVSNDKIDEINIYEATKLAMKQSIEELEIQPDIALIDAVKIDNFKIPTKSIIKGDEQSITIAAASVLAKVTRDRMMDKIAREYPRYGFEKHKGYGTKAHLNKLRDYGATPYHRYSFSPVKNLSN